MSVKKQVILEAIARVNRKIAKNKELIYGNPYPEIFECNRLISELLRNHTVEELAKKEIQAKFDTLMARGKKATRFAELQQEADTISLIKEVVKLERELYELNSELSNMDLKERIKKGLF